jgi:hypothetical protein
LIADIGLRLFYVVGGTRIESTVIGSGAMPVTLVTVPNCQMIDRLAAAGHTIAYVVTVPAAPEGGRPGCGAQSYTAWHLWLHDLESGAARQVASGLVNPSFVDAAEFPVHIALSGSAYAIDLPPAVPEAPQLDTVEVHALDGSLQWRASTQAQVLSIMLAGSRLAMLTAPADGTSPRDDLWLGDRVSSGFRLVAQPFGSASISSDGAYIAWDLPPAGPESDPPLPGGSSGQLRVESLGLGPTDLAQRVSLSGESSPAVLNPVVSSTDRGPLVAWLPTSPEGSVFVAFQYSWQFSGVAIASIERPVWLTLQGSTLLWVTETSGGGVPAAFALDLSRIAFP